MAASNLALRSTLGSIIAVFQFVCLCAQQGGVRGIVVDDSSGKALRGVSVLLRRASDSSFVQGVRSSAQGHFQFKSQGTESLFLETQRLGYAPLRRFITSADLIGEGIRLRLHSVAIVTADVEVSAWRDYQEIQADKKSYQISENPNIVASNVSEVLDQIPSVQVDETGAIQLRGDANVQIMIDDRPLKMDTEQRNKFLQQLSSGELEKIEVRTTPGARFDARSTAGIINIVTKRRVGDYLGGTASANASSSGRRGASLSVLYSDTLINAAVAVGWNRWFESNHSVYERLTPVDPAVSRLNKTVDYTNTDNTYYVRPQVDLKLGSVDRLSFSSTMNVSPSHSEGMGIGDRHGIHSELLQFVNDTSSNSQQASWMDFSLVYKHNFQEDEYLRAECSYSQFSPVHYDTNFSIMHDTLWQLEPTLSFRQKMYSTNRHPEYNVGIDYARQLTADLSLEAGLKYSAEHHNNEYGTDTWNFSTQSYLRDSVASLHTATYVDVSAAYATLAWKLNKDCSVNAGLRWMSASVGNNDTINPIAHTYQSVFPDFSCAYTFSESFSMTASYNRRVQLPEVDELNPRLYQISSTFVLVGNPNLRPQYTNTFELSTVLQHGAFEFTLNPFHRLATDVIRGSGYLSGPLIMNGTQNFKSETNSGCDLDVSYRQRNAWSTRLGGTVYAYHNTGSDVPGDSPVSSTFVSGHLNISYQILKTLSISAAMRHVIPYHSGSEDNGSYTTNSISISSKLLENSLQLQLLLSDPLNIQHRERTKYGEGYSLYSNSKSLSRYALLTLSYTFGHQGVKLEQHERKQNDG